MKKILLLLTLSTLICYSCSTIDQNSNIDQKQFEYPVLKSKDFNHVLQLNIQREDTLKKTSIKEIIIDTKNTSNINDIESITIFYNGNSSEPISNESILFSKTKEIGPLVNLKGLVELTGKDNYFWISYKLKDNADILNFVSALCQKAYSNNGEVKVSKIEKPKKLRMGVAVRKHNDDNVHTFRIPALISTNKGTLIAAYDARRNSDKDLQGDIDIGFNRSTDRGNTWQPMGIALDMGEYGNLPQKFNGVSDASLTVDKNTGHLFVAGLWMYGVINKEGKWVENLNNNSKDWNHQWKNKGSQSGFGLKQTSQFIISRSIDDGVTWEKPINLTKMCKKKEWWLWAPAPGNGITLIDGTLVLPTQGRNENGLPFSNITYSKDGGATWKTSKPAYTNTTECAVVQLNDGSLMLNIRNNRNRQNKGENNGRAIATSSNLGETWVEHKTSTSALIESVCMASLFKHNSILYFSNPNTKQGRHHTTIKVSSDDGETWPVKNWLLLDEGSSRGYSSLTNVDDNTLGILYESSQADLVFQKIPLSEFNK